MLKKIEGVLIALERGLLVALLSAIIAISFTQVALRNFFSTGILWADTLSRHLVLWVGFLGAALATVENKHFAWDTVVELLKERPKAAVSLLAHLAASAVLFFLVKASWAFCREEKASASVLFNAGALAVPAWTFWVIIPAGFFLILFHTLVRAADEAAALAGKK